MSVMGNSEVVLFDEPTSGLDPESKRLLWNVMLALFRETQMSNGSAGTSGGRSRSCVLTTHSLEEAEALCSRIAIMLRGQIHALGKFYSYKLIIAALIINCGINLYGSIPQELFSN